MVCGTEDKHILFTIPDKNINQLSIQAKNELSFEFIHYHQKQTHKSHASRLQNH